MFEGDGIGFLECRDLKWHWIAAFVRSLEEEFEDVSFVVHSTNMCIHHQARHYALSDFLAETHFDP